MADSEGVGGLPLRSATSKAIGNVTEHDLATIRRPPTALQKDTGVQ